MRATFFLCFSFVALGACGTSHEEASEPAGAPPPMQASGPDHTTMWAEPAGLFLAGLDGGQASLTHARFQGSIDAQWAAADADGDGTLRTFELQAWRIKWFGSDDGWPGLFHFDADSDGVVGKAEFKTALEGIFTTFDKNQDGRVDRSELLVEKRRPEMRFGPRGGGAAKPDRAGESSGGAGEGHPAEAPKPKTPAAP